MTPEEFKLRYGYEPSQGLLDAWASGPRATPSYTGPWGPTREAVGAAVNPFTTPSVMGRDSPEDRAAVGGMRRGLTSLLDPMFYGSAVGDVISKEASMTDEPSLMEYAMGALEASPLAWTKAIKPAFQAVSKFRPNLGPASLTQNIIRRDTAQQVEGSTLIPPWYSDSLLAKPLHMGAGVLRGMGDMVQLLVSPKASHLFKKYGIAPSMARDLRRDFATQAEILRRSEAGEPLLKQKGWWGKEGEKDVSSATLRNQIHARLTYMDSMLRKYMPDDKRRQAFEAELSGFLFPIQRYTTAANLATDATPLREVLDLPAQISDQGIIDHLNPFIKKWWNLKGPIAINAKALQAHPRNTLWTHAKKSGKVTPIQDFLDIWKQMDEPLTKANVLNFARGHNKALQDLLDEAYNTTLRQRKSVVYADSSANRAKGIAGKRRYTDKRAEEVAEEARTAARRDLAKKHSSERFYDVKAIEKELLDEGDYISMGGEMLSADRLLAHVQNRIVIPKNSPDEGVWTVLDIMRQGQSDIPFVGKALEKTFETGSKYDFVVGEVYPVTRIGGEGAARKIDAERGAGTWGVESFQTKNPPTAQTDAAIRKITEGMLASEPAMGEVVEKLAPLGLLGSAAAYDQYRSAGSRKRKPPPQQGLLGPY